jgi:hypothetical protein
MPLFRIGDSNGQGWQAGGTWAQLLTRDLGWREWNHAQAGSRMNADASGRFLVLTAIFHR